MLLKLEWEDIKEKRQRNEATNVENDLFTTLEIVNEMLERGFTFGQLDLYKSQATEFLIEGDTLIPPFIALEVWVRTLLSKWLLRVKKGSSFPRQNCVNEEACHQPWLKNWMKWES